MRVEEFVSGGKSKIFANPPPVIQVPSRQYPVTTHFSKRTDVVDYIGQAYKKILSIQMTKNLNSSIVVVSQDFDIKEIDEAFKMDGQTDSDEYDHLKP